MSERLKPQLPTDADLPAGFRFASTACGIKPSGSSDLSLVVADRPVVAAGVYTQNQVVAAPVVLCRQRTPRDGIRAIVTNSGNANACTGDQGHRDARRMSEAVAEAIGCEADQVLVMSTGVIGHHLPMSKVETGIADVAANLTSGATAYRAVADAIRTTDRCEKTSHRKVSTASGEIRIAAMAKGAGMIEPNMATLLALVITDATLTPTLAGETLKRAADASLNRISVDGHTSTNDTLLLLASGERKFLAADELKAFESALTDALIDLGKLIVADGEGADHYVDLIVDGAANDADAETIARSVASSPLVKTAITGNDPNWGRIVSAAGYADAPMEPHETSLRLLGVPIYQQGTPLGYDAASLSKQMAASEQIDVHLTVGTGPGKARFWASDLTKAYVEFNSEYTT